jgi:hypothetical protein
MAMSRSTYLSCDTLMESLAVPPSGRAVVTGMLQLAGRGVNSHSLRIACPACGKGHLIDRLLPGSWDIYCCGKWLPVLINMVIVDFAETEDRERREPPRPCAPADSALSSDVSLRKGLATQRLSGRE